MDEEDADYQWFSAFQDVNNGNADDAITTLNGINDNPRSLIALKSNWLLGYIYEELEQDSLAINHYKKAIEKGPIPNYIDYYLESVYHYGNMLYQNNEIDGSKELYQKALNESLKFKVRRLVPFGYYHLAKVAEASGKQEKALDYYNKSVNYFTDELNTPDHFMIGFINRKIKTLEK